jgi:uncharacterized protein involved in response to NO
LRKEPFRLFFPLGVVAGWAGVGHWVLYTTGVTSTYSCFAHGLVQMQSFMIAFALGFLFTALPRRTRSDHPSTIEIAISAAALAWVAATALAQAFGAAQVGYVVLLILLLRFAAGRLLGVRAERRPPASFVLIPVGLAHGIAGASLIFAGTVLGLAPWTTLLGRLLVEQGVFLCFAIGVGGLILPLVAGESPPRDLGDSPGEMRSLIVYTGVGAAIFGSFVFEQLGFARLAPLVRAATVASGLAFGRAAWRAPRKPGLHRRLVWASLWLMPLGLGASALLPDLRVAALHVLFIGGFATLAFGVATHVAFGHLGLEADARGRPLAVVVLAVGLSLALAARLAADASHSYFAHLGWAAAVWIVGTVVWLAYLLPKLLRS